MIISWIVIFLIMAALITTISLPVHCFVRKIPLIQTVKTPKYWGFTVAVSFIVSLIAVFLA